MSVSNPRREAYRILRRVEEAGAFASALLESRPPSRDQRDAALVTEIVLGVLRRRAVIDHAVARVASRPIDGIEPAVREALRVGTYSILFLDRVPDFAAVDTAVTLVKEAGHAKAAGFVNGVLRRVAREGEALLPPAPVRGDAAALALYRSHPAWWVERLVRRLGWEEADALLAADNEPAATTLAPRGPGLAEALAREGVVTEPCAEVPGALRVTSGVPQQTEAFRAGAFWMQDEASQRVVRLFGDRVGPRVADVCAAPGGKSLGLAARLAKGGVVVALDRHAHRLRRVVANAGRVGVTSIVTVAADMTREAPLAGTFDDVLVDAPCSGTGTLRRHPEIRWRLRPDDLPVLAARQRKILASAAALVRPGGRLGYAVCSLEPEEGEEVVASFLDAHPAFSRTGEILRTSPAHAPQDGFYAVLLTRRSE
ncbi:MAG TPA: 16S rRNA (cytosine(967)-C(5))-methyltransferase RsmB [Candidatus Polarisedimenticolaceae bacterium]|nr:16S rRNA (cytosine(967)-C(5))-methyltransferase RsmB [Candidatus Polarisedimenticolaceae bacterium]